MCSLMLLKQYLIHKYKKFKFLNSYLKLKVWENWDKKVFLIIILMWRI